MQKNSEYRLKRCPFCGGQARILSTWDGLYKAECKCCTCGTASYTTQIAVARRWNQRADSYLAKWIPCEERLPENENPCLVICRTWSMTENAWKEGTLMILRYLPKEHRWNISGMTDVTHWMPMPELPEMEDEIHD